MKLCLFHRFYLLQSKNCKSSLKCASTVAVEQQKKSNNQISYYKKKKKNVFFTPALKIQKLQALNTVCSVSHSINHISWAKVSVPDLILLDWDGYELPPKLLTKKVESNYSSLAKEIREKIPSAELYVIENQRKWISSINETNLRAMLIFLLSYDRGLMDDEKVIFQKASLVNRTHELLIGNERKSARPIVISLLQVTKSENEPDCKCNKYPNWYSKLEVPETIDRFFSNCRKNKQESLSLALLITLSFINQNYFENLNQVQESP